MSRKVTQTILVIAVLAVVFCVVYDLQNTLLPRTALESRAGWLALATLLLGLPFGAITASQWPSHRVAIFIRAVGVTGWIFLIAGYESLGIGSGLGIFITEIPLVAIVFSNHGFSKSNGFGEPAFLEDRRAPIVVMAVCTGIVTLVSAGHLPMSANVFLTALTVAQAIGAMFPDLIEPNPRWHGPSDAGPSTSNEEG